ncbi:MAG: hypothetical protein PWQ62_866 [Candidatus Methanomethylophilaceae archaeon]|nr:hypothetical protein [Candidatus Methanomethylophilaceae archaeon]
MQELNGNGNSVQIPGLGPKRLDSLKNHGIKTIEDLIEIPFESLLKVPLIGFKSAYNIKVYLGIEIDYPSMIKADHIQFDDNVVIENKTIRSWRNYKKSIINGMQPENFQLQRTTVWSFPDRGDWASHTPQYRGNWSPHVARNVILRYSQPGDLVLDPMVGGGTTPVECKLLNRNSISVDINPDAIRITKDRLDLPKDNLELEETDHWLFIGDVRNLNSIRDETIDLIASHPPYANIIKYAPKHDGDLSLINDYGIFFKEFSKAIKEMYRVLKPGAYCAILIGDTHNKSHYVPTSARMMMDFLKEGFILKEDIIKKEWNCESDRYLKKYSNSNFLLTMHEHLFIFRKPKIDEKIQEFKNSSIGFFDPK